MPEPADGGARDLHGPRFYTKLLAALGPSLYILWIIICSTGGKGGAFAALNALYPLSVLFNSLA